MGAVFGVADETAADHAGADVDLHVSEDAVEPVPSGVDRMHRGATLADGGSHRRRVLGSSQISLDY